MTSCGGTVSVIVRRSTLTIRSTIGMRMKRPGPFGSASRRPSRKMMPRSYSRATLMAEKRKRTSRKRSAAAMKSAAFMPGSYGMRCLGPLRPHREDEPVEGLHANTLAGAELLPAGRARLPQLPVDDDEAVAAHLSHGAGDPLREIGRAHV